MALAAFSGSLVVPSGQGLDDPHSHVHSVFVQWHPPPPPPPPLIGATHAVPDQISPLGQQWPSDPTSPLGQQIPLLFTSPLGQHMLFEQVVSPEQVPHSIVWPQLFTREPQVSV